MGKGAFAEPVMPNGPATIAAAAVPRNRRRVCLTCSIYFTPIGTRHARQSRAGCCESPVTSVDAGFSVRAPTSQTAGSGESEAFALLSRGSISNGKAIRVPRKPGPGSWNPGYAGESALIGLEVKLENTLALNRRSVAAGRRESPEDRGLRGGGAQ